MIVTLIERFWDKVDRKGPDECWPWTGAKSQAGYGTLGLPRAIRKGTKSVQATHLSLAIAGIRRPFGGVHALHSCDNPECVNPAHLRWGTPLENQQDAIDRRRRPTSERREAARELMDQRAAAISMGKS